MSPSARGQKRDRERQRAERVVEKQARKAQRTAEAAAAASEPGDTGGPSEDVVLAALAALHQRFADDEIDFEEFAAQRDELTSRLRID